MIVSIVIKGRFKNQVIEKNILDSQLMPYLIFLNQNGLYCEDAWYPSHRIKEVRFSEPAAPMQSRRFVEEDKDE